MTHDDHSALVRLIAATLDQHVRGDAADLAEHIADELQAGYRIAKSDAAGGRPAPSRPHLWPQASGASARGVHCLICGAAFWGRRAEGPCQPHE
jgi:hypothetical protein